ncbi:MAG: aspartyl protease family protein [Candidatus Eremiobacteraeota bacterium]|nr:aspartyl protease family protein [Candidatus Eremiobacteraeota bacterium]
MAAAILAFVLTGAASPSLTDVLDAHLRAIAALHVKEPATLVTAGRLDGLDLHGTFQSWHDGTHERYDEMLGLLAQRTLRTGDTQYVQNANGDVRVLHGLLARRQITEDFIDSEAFARHPENDELLGSATLPDGRTVWRVRVAPPGGEPFEIALDATTSLIDQKAYVEGDALATSTYDDYRVIKGALVPYLEVDSSGNHAFDVTSKVESVAVNDPIDAAIFAPFTSTVVDAPEPVTVPLLSDRGHYFVRASAGQTPLLFLVDSGSQGMFLDPGAAQRLALKTEGKIEVRGAQRTTGLGVAALEAIDIGGARLPLHVVSVIDLHAVTYNGATVDGVLGYPFFAAAEVRIDPDKMTMTIGKPGTLPSQGSAIAVDTDRELPETDAKINDVEGRFLLDTGNSNELLVFHSFVRRHPSAVFYAGSKFTGNSGVGGSSSAVRAIVDQIEIGPFKLYNRYADVMLAEQGAFADRTEAGNIGLGTLSNFVFTFDLPHRTLFLEPARSFDNGRFRTREGSAPPFMRR